MLLGREALPNESCIDCGRPFKPGETGIMVRRDLGPFIDCHECVEKRKQGTEDAE